MGTTTIRLPADQEETLEQLAQQLQRSKSWIINQALTDYVAKQKLEQTRWNQTLEAMESAAQGKVMEAGEVHTWLESWGTDHEQEAPKR